MEAGVRLEMIQFLRVTRRFASGQVGLDEVSLEIDAGEFIFITGESGAGKSTLLALVYGALSPTTGNVLVNGRNVGSLPRSKIPYLRRTIGVVFQNSGLIRRKTVYENVAYLPQILGLSAAEQREKVYAALDQVGLADRGDAFPMQLSGGEQQRVAIARALVNEPAIVLADEPTGNLDPELSERIFELFTAANERGATVVVATHDPHAIERLPARVLRLHQGQLIADSERQSATSPRAVVAEP